MPWVPGESLLIKMWETLAERGIGRLLSPWQMKREGAAQLEIRQREIVGLAAAERMASEIQSGRVSAEEINRRFALLPAPGDVREIEHSAESPPAALMATVTQTVVADTIRREVNVAKAVAQAEAEIRDDPAQAPTENVNEDWLYKWRDYASEVSSEELQSLWGKVLAGELKTPGSFSLRTLEFIRNLSKADAELISKVAPYVVENLILKVPKFLEPRGIVFNMFLVLQEMGILAGVEGHLQTKWDSTQADRFCCVLRANGKGVLIEADDPRKVASLPAYKLTTPGEQIFRLVNCAADLGYLREAGRQLMKHGFRVKLVDYWLVPQGISWATETQEEITLLPTDGAPVPPAVP